MKHPEGAAPVRGPLSFGPICLAATAVLLGLHAPARAAESVPLSFGRIAIGEPLEQEIGFDNPIDARLEIARIRLTAPLSVPRLTSVVPAGGRGSFTLRLGEPRRPGPFEGMVVVEFASDDVEPLVFEVRGYLVPPIELLPRSVVVLSTLRGTPREELVDVVVHRAEPVALAIDEVEGPDLSAQLETVEAGRRYRIVVRVEGDGPAGRRQGVVRLRAVGADMEAPVLTVLGRVVERVRTFPEAVDFGDFPIAALREPGAAERLAQTVMVYRRGEPGFEIEVASDLPFMRIEAERGPAGDQWQLTLRLDPATSPVGPIDGELVVSTNDVEFPRLVVPVSGRLVGAQSAPESGPPAGERAGVDE